MMRPAVCTLTAVLVSMCAFRGTDAIVMEQKDQPAPKGYVKMDDGRYVKMDQLGGVPGSELNHVSDLHKQYYNIFKHGNRNAASHLWSTFLLDRSHQMTHDKLAYMFSGFCAVSGSPVEPQDRTRYRVTLDKVGGGTHTGFMYHCCWPCTCDAKDMIKIDTKNITLSSGEVRQYHFTVIGNPCNNPAKLDEPFADAFRGEQTTLKQQAPEVECDQNGQLQGAHLSDNGHVILSMFHDEDKSVNFMDDTVFHDQCTQRASQGYASGMGEIFRKVAAITPVNLNPQSLAQVKLPAPPATGAATQQKTAPPATGAAPQQKPAPPATGAATQQKPQV